MAQAASARVHPDIKIVRIALTAVRAQYAGTVRCKRCLLFDTRASRNTKHAPLHKLHVSITMHDFRLDPQYQDGGMLGINHIIINHREEVGALKRLQREVFESLSELADRTFKLEKADAMREADGGGGGRRGWTAGADIAPEAAARVAVAGAVEVAPAALLSQVHPRLLACRGIC